MPQLGVVRQTACYFTKNGIKEGKASVVKKRR